MKSKNTKQLEIEEKMEIIRKENEEADREQRKQAFKDWDMRRKLSDK